MPRVEHHQLRAHSTKSFAGRSLYLRQEDGSPVQFPHGIPTPAPVQDIEARGLIGNVLGTVTTAVKSLTDLLGLTGSDPTPPPPAGGGGGGGGSTSSSPGSTTGNPGSGSSTQGPSSSSSPANPTSGNPGNGNTNPGSGSGNGNGNTGNGTGDGNGNGDNPPNTATTGTPSPSTDASLPSSTTPSNTGSPPANQETPPGDTNEGSPPGSSGTPNAADSSGDSHYQGGPNLPGDAADASSDVVTSIGGVANAANGVLTGNGSPTGTGAIASTTDANGNVVPVSPTSSGGPRNPNAASSSTRIGIAIGVTLAILAILAGLFVLRKRRIAKRKDTRQRWWSSRRRGLAESSEYYGDEKANLPPSPSNHAISPFNTPMVPSSPFVPTFPAPPPLAEVRKPANLIDHPVSTQSPSSEARPLSTGSLISFASSNSSNGLPPMSFTTVTLTEESGTTGQSYHRFSSPPPSSDEHFLSFRHVSPPPSSDDHFPSFHHNHTSPPPSSDEHFEFPTPRIPAQAAIDRTSAYFQPRSPTLSRSSSTVSGSTSQSSSTDDSASAPRTLNIQISSSTGHGHERDSNPFADPTAYDISDLPQQPHHPDNRPTSLATDKDGSLRYSLTNSVASDPFSSGCGSLIASSCYNAFEEFEKVHVSFLGNLSDELSLRRGDEVRVLKIFEDGWALVVRSIQDGVEDAERGVIPVVCLSERLAGTAGVVRPERGDSYTMSANIG